MSSFAIHNFGCRVNQAEAFSWAEEFQSRGLKLEKDPGKTDLVLVNTCTLTGRADRDVRKFVRKIQQQNPRAKMVVTGCSVDQLRDELEKNPHVWLLIPNSRKEDLAKTVLSGLSPKKEISALPFRSRAILKVQDGCDFRCTFCIIPQVRGKSTSVPQEEILSRIKKFADRGYREIVLAGIHLCSYGLDFEVRSSLLQLLQDIEKVEGLGKVRLSSLDPRFLTESLLEFLTASQKICPHFHLSLQHGADRMLKLMGRSSCVSEYEKILTRLRQNSPDASLGADIIVGFPGEAEDDFARAYDFLEKSPLTYFHVFSYSPRPGTAASAWPQVDAKIKKERSSLLRKLSQEKQAVFRSLFLGRELVGIFIKRRNSGGEALTSNYLQVHVPGCENREGEEVKVRITNVQSKEISGEIAD